jgi:hypothetical protein
MTEEVTSFLGVHLAGAPFPPYLIFSGPWCSYATDLKK